MNLLIVQKTSKCSELILLFRFLYHASISYSIVECAHFNFHEPFPISNFIPFQTRINQVSSETFYNFTSDENTISAVVLLAKYVLYRLLTRILSRAPIIILKLENCINPQQIPFRQEQTLLNIIITTSHRIRYHKKKVGKSVLDMLRLKDN